MATSWKSKSDSFRSAMRNARKISEAQVECYIMNNIFHYVYEYYDTSGCMNKNVIQGGEHS